MYVYRPSAEMDLLLLQLWGRLAGTGDLTKLLHPRGQLPFHFMEDCQAPAVTLLEVREKGVWFFCRLEPFYSGAGICLWIAPEMRYTKEGLKALEDAHDRAFQRFPVLVAVTTQPQLAKEMRTIGYQAQGKIPGLFGLDGPDAATFSVTKDQLKLGRVWSGQRVREN